MSASAIVVQVAAVCSDCTIREPIAWRIRESGWPTPVAAGAGAALGTSSMRPIRGRRCLGATGSSGRYGLSMCIGGSSLGPLSTYASTSCLRTRPSRPVPSTCSRSTSCSAAIRMTTGE